MAKVDGAAVGVLNAGVRDGAGLAVVVVGVDGKESSGPAVIAVHSGGWDGDTGDLLSVFLVGLVDPWLLNQ